MACPDCGSWSVKADRGLSGRMVCGRCGQPLGISSRRRGGWPGGRSRRIGRPSLRRLLVLLLGCGALLTALLERPGPAPGPPPWVWPSPDRVDPEAKRSAIMIRNIAS